MTNQIPLDVQLREETTFDNFYVGNNQALLEHLKSIANIEDKTLTKITYIWGANGVGRTHLLQACCRMAGDRKLTSTYIPLAHYQEYTTHVFDGMEALDLVCIDDVHCISQAGKWQETLFHFYNRALTSDVQIVVSGLQSPRELDISLTDLVTRLASAVVYQVQPLADEQKLLAIKSHAECKGLELTETVAKYLLEHCPRNMRDLTNTLEMLDVASLAAKRKLTVPFIKATLGV